jgi:hypothetical protein
MAKARDIPSIEQGLHEAFRILKDAGIEEAIKNFTGKQKSASFYRSCSDPDEIHKIDHTDSLAIDYECLKTKGIAPMLSAHEALVTKFLLNQNKEEVSKTLSQVMNELNIIIGEFQTTVHSAQSPSSPGGIKLTSEEKMKVKKAIVKLEQILLHLQISVGED